MASQSAIFERVEVSGVGLRISIIHMIVFTGFVALQLRSLQLRNVGLIIMAIAVPVALFVMIVSAFTSQSREEMLVVDENECFRFFRRVLFWSVMNFAVLAILNILKFNW